MASRLEAPILSSEQSSPSELHHEHPQTQFCLKQLKEQTHHGIEAVRDTIERLIKESQTPPDLQPSLPPDKSKKENAISRIFHQLKYPSTTDVIYTTFRLVTPAISLELISVLGLRATSLLIKSDLPLDLTVKLYNASRYSVMATTTILVASIALISWQHLRARHNFEYFSRLLSVGKTATSAKNYLSLTYPQTNNYPFYGELHFVDRTDADRELFKNPVAAIRDAFTGLLALAEACEQNDPRLDGIEIFGGISSIIDQRLEKFGFQVAEPKLDINLMDRTFAPVMTWLGKLFPKQDYNIPDQPPMVCFITRESLIANKAKFARFAK